MTDKQSILTKNVQGTIANKQTPVGKAYQYYLKGLTAAEIAILLNVSERTVQRWKTAFKFDGYSQPVGLQSRVVELRKKGMSYTAIAKALHISRSTVYNNLKLSGGIGK